MLNHFGGAQHVADEGEFAKSPVARHGEMVAPMGAKVKASIANLLEFVRFCHGPTYLQRLLEEFAKVRH